MPAHPSAARQSRRAGRNKKAQRFSAGMALVKYPSASGTAYADSSEDVSVIVSDLGFLQDRYQLFLKAARRMMARLIPDVRGHRPFMCRADAESRVSLLPGKTGVVAIQPSRAIAFQ